jgi:hypothetical protein
MANEDPQLVLVGELVDLLASLVDDLQFANEIFRNKDDKGLDGAILAVGAVVKFLFNSKFENRHALVAPLISLQAALTDLQDGTISPMFRVGRPKNRPANPSNRQAISQYAGAILELLMRTKMKSDEAAIRVARILVRHSVTLPYRSGERDPDSTTVKKWRSKYRNVPPEDAEYFRSLVDNEEFDTGGLEELRAKILSKFEYVIQNYTIAI